MTTREAFEKWISQPPYERLLGRVPNDSTRFAWPDQYVDIGVQLAWEAWQASDDSTIHTCHDQCQRPMCVSRRDRDAWRKMAEQLAEYVARIGYVSCQDGAFIHQATEALSAFREMEKKA